MGKVERKIKDIGGSGIARDSAAQNPGRLSESQSKLLRHLQETEEMIRQRIESETLLIDELIELATVHRGNIQLRMSRVNMHDVIA